VTTRIDFAGSNHRTKKLGTKEAEMKIVGCALYAKQQTIAMVDTDTGEFIERTLSHDGSVVREF
jgi:hypothetical protein